MTDVGGKDGRRLAPVAGSSPASRRPRRTQAADRPALARPTVANGVRARPAAKDSGGTSTRREAGPPIIFQNPCPVDDPINASEGRLAARGTTPLGPVHPPRLRATGGGPRSATVVPDRAAASCSRPTGRLPVSTIHE